MSQPEFDTVMIAVASLQEYPGNPNEQDPATFNNLVREIESDGWDEPVVVVPAANIPNMGTTGYVVVSGNHRLKAAHVLGFDKIPCRVKLDWDEDTAKIKVVRRNLLRGEHNPQKFARLVDSFESKYTQAQLADAMGFRDMAEFEKIYAKEVEEENNRGKEAIENNKEEVNLIGGMSTILNRLFEEYGDTVPHSFMFFLAGSKIHLVVQTNTKLKKLLELITKRCVKDSLDINLALAGLLGIGVKVTQFEMGPPERAAIEGEALEMSDEEYELHPVTAKDT
jgi:hypothetical protein